MTSRGRVAIVGAGPGDPGLLTLAAAKALAEADVVLYDALVAPEILAHARRGAELRYTGKRSSNHALSQAKMQELMLERAKAGLAVVRLKGGDPFVFGRGSEEAEACRAEGVPYIVVPGIPSAIAAPAYAGIPVTHRGISGNFLVMTGHQAEGEAGPDWDFAAKAETLLILMGIENLGGIVRGLLGAGKPPETPVAGVRWGTRSDQQVVSATLGTIETVACAEGLASPAVIVIGGVAALGERLAWFDPGPLAGRRIVVARARAQASDLAERLRGLGAHVSEIPAIEAELRSSDAEFQSAITSRPAWLVLPAVASVTAAMEAIDAAGFDIRVLGNTKIAVFGQGTVAKLREFGLKPDFVPSKATLSALASELPVVAGETVVVAASSAATDDAAKELRARGVEVVQIAAFAEVARPIDDQQRREFEDADLVIFTSASTVTNLFDALEGTPVPQNAKLLSIGPQTSARMLATFGRIDIEASSANLDGVVEAVLGAAR